MDKKNVSPSDMTAEERLREIAEIVSKGLICKRFQALYQKGNESAVKNEILGDKI